MIVSDQVMAALASAAIPTVAVLVGMLTNNRRLNESSRSIGQRFIDTNRYIDDMKDALRADMFHFERVMDARLKHLEETTRYKIRSAQVLAPFCTSDTPVGSGFAKILL